MDILLTCGILLVEPSSPSRDQPPSTVTPVVNAPIFLSANCVIPNPLSSAPSAYPKVTLPSLA